MAINFDTHYNTLNTLLNNDKHPSPKWKIIKITLAATKAIRSIEDLKKLQALEKKIYQSFTGSSLSVVQTLFSSALNLYHNGIFKHSHSLFQDISLIWRVQKIFKNQSENNETFSKIEKHLYKGNIAKARKLINSLEGKELTQSVLKILSDFPYQRFPPINERLFAHLLSDASVENTELEGSSTDLNIAWLRSFFRASFEKGPAYKEIYNIFDTYINPNRCSASYIKNRVLQLKKGKSLLISGGWLTKEGGHAVLYQFKKKNDANNLYDIFIYNTGSGSTTYHHTLSYSENDLQKTLICPFVKFQNVPGATLNEPSFFTTLQTLGIPKDTSHSDQCETLYKNFAFWDSYRVRKEPELSSFMTPQRAGTCSMHCLFAFLRTELPLKEYKATKVEIKKAALNQFYEQEFLHKKHTASARKKTLFIEAAEKFARALAKNVEQGAISPQEAEDLLTKLSWQKEHVLSLREKEKTSFGFPSLRFLHYIPILIKKSPIKALKTIKPSHVDIKILSVPPAKELYAFLLQFHKLERDSPTSIENLANALPIGTDYWKAIPEKDRPFVMSLLWSLAHSYRPNSFAALPIQINTRWALVAHAHALSCVIDPKLEEYSIDYQPFLEKAHGFIPFLNPKDWEKRKELLAYFQAKNKKFKLFKSGCVNTFNTREIFKNNEFFEADAQTLLRIAKEHPLANIEFKKTQYQIRKKTLKQSPHPNNDAVEIAAVLTNNTIFSHKKTRYIKELQTITHLAQNCKSSTPHSIYVYDSLFPYSVKGKIFNYEINWKDRNTGKTINSKPKPDSIQYETDLQGPSQFWHNFSRNPQENLSLPTVFKKSDQSENSIINSPDDPMEVKQWAVNLTQNPLQCQKVLSDFETTLPLLSNEMEQEAFLCMLFYSSPTQDTPSLTQALKNPAFCEGLQQCIKKGFSHFSQKSKAEKAHLSGYLFFFQLIRRIHEIDPDFLQRYPIDIDGEKELTNLLNNPSFSRQEKVQIHLHKALLSKNDTDFFASFMFVKLYSKKPTSWCNYHQQEELHRQSSHKLSLLTKENFSESNLNKILSIVLEEPINCTWTCKQYPLFSGTSKEGTRWLMDIGSGKITRNGEQIAATTTTHSKNLALFGANTFEATQVGNSLEFKDAYGNRFRELIRPLPKSQLHENLEIFQLYHENTWLQHVPVQALKKYPHHKTFRYKNSIPHYLLVNYLVFTDGFHVFFLDKKTKEIIAQTKGTSIISKKGSKILRRNEVKYPKFDAIEPSKWHLYFQKKDGTKIAHFPRLFSLQNRPLKMICNPGQKDFVWEANPSFILTSIPRKENPFGSFKNFLLLRNEKGMQKALVPVKEVEPTKEYIPSCAFDIKEPDKEQKVLNSTPKTFTFLEYDIIDGIPTPLTIESRLYLVYLYLTQKKPHLAFEVLKKTPTSFEKTALIEEILTKIIKFPKDSSASDGPCIALALKAGVLLTKIQEKAQGPVPELEDLINQYQQQRNNIQGLDLSFEEQKILNFPIRERTINAFKAEISSWDAITTMPIIYPDGNKLTNPWWLWSTTEQEIYTPAHLLDIYDQMCKAKNDPERWKIAKKHLSNQSITSEWKSLFAIFMHWDELKHLFPENTTMNSLVRRGSDEYAILHPVDKQKFQRIKEHFINKRKSVQNLINDRIDSSLTKRVGLTTLAQRVTKLQDNHSIHFTQKVTTTTLTLPAVNPQSILGDFFLQTKKQEKDVKLILNPPSLDNPDHRAIRAEQQYIQESFEQGKKEPETIFSLQEGKNLEDVHKTLQEKIDSINPELENQKKCILELANTLPLDPNQKILKTQLLEGKFQNPILLEQLITTFLEGSYKSYQTLNPHLSQEQIQELDQKIANFLYSSNKLDQIKRALAEQDIHICGKELAALQGYDFTKDTDRIFLVFEHRANLCLKEKQITLIRNMVEKQENGTYKDCIGELIMGGGKTSVLTSILLHMAAKQGRIAFFTAPASQFSNLASDLATRQKTNFYNEIITMNFKKEDLTEKRLIWIRDQLLDAKQNQKAILATPETLQMLPLELYCLLNTEHQSEEDRIKITILKEITREMKQYGDLLIDEVDIVLTAKNEMIFTQGEKTAISQKEIDIVQEIVSYHIEETDLGLIENRQSHYGKENYQRQIFSRIQDKFFNNHPEFVPHKRYILGLEKTLPIGLSPEITFQINAVKETLYFIPMTLEKSHNQRYGRTNKGSQEAVIPYSSCQNPTTREFGSPIESALYHFQTVLCQGVSLPQLRNLIANYDQQATLIAYHQETAFEDTLPAKQFEKITGFSLLTCLQTDNLEKILEKINEDPHKKLLAEREIIQKVVGSYTGHFMGSAQTFCSQFATKRAFSGTPWNACAMPKSMQENTFLDLGTQGKIILACLEKQTNTSVAMVDPTPRSILEKCPSIQGIIDSAGLFKEEKGEEIAQQILDLTHPEKIKTVLFFGQDNALWALKRGEKDPIRIASTLKEEIKKYAIAMESTFVCYDESHCEATDIAQDPEAKNALSFDHYTSLRTLLQGLLRLRKFFEKQDAYYIISSLEKKHFPSEITVQTLIEKGIDNQAKEKTKETTKSYKHKIDALFEEQLFDRVLEGNSFGRFKEFFLHSSKESYPSNLIEYANERFELLQKKDADIARKILPKLTALKEEIQTSAYYSQSVAMESEVQVQVQLQKEVQEEKTTQLQKELQLELQRYQQHQKKPSIEERTWSSYKPKDFSITPYKTHSSATVTIHPLDSILKKSPHEHDYFKLFETLPIYASYNFAHTAESLYPFFSQKQKKAKQILFFEKAGTICALLLSSKDAKLFLENNPNAYLLLPSGRSYRNPRPPKEWQNSINTLLWHINFLEGNLPYLIKHPNKDLIKEDPLWKRFLEIKTQNPQAKQLIQEALKAKEHS